MRVVDKRPCPMTVGEFEEWMMKSFDKNKDGMISVRELQDAITARGRGWWMARSGVQKADTNANGSIDFHEIGNLWDFAENALGIKVLPST